MSYSAKFISARLQEQKNRLQTHLAVPPPFRYRLANGNSAIVPQSHYTERHRMELLAASNPFVVGEAGTLGDLFQVLWRLHPLFYRRADDSFPNKRTAPTLVTYLKSWWARRRLVSQVALADISQVAPALIARLAESDQDEPASDSSDFAAAPPVSSKPPINTWDDLSDYFCRTWFMDPSDIWDRPRALLWQLHRNRLLAAPDGELDVIDPSDVYLSER